MSDGVQQVVRVARPSDRKHDGVWHRQADPDEAGETDRLAADHVLPGFQRRGERQRRYASGCIHAIRCL